MKLTLVLDHRYVVSTGGGIYSPNGRGYSFLSRYLEVFDSLDVVARIEPGSVRDGWETAEGKGVRFVPFPAYRGIAGYVRSYPEIRAASRIAVERSEAILLRVPGAVSSSIFALASASGIPFGAEVVGDPWDALSVGLPEPIRFGVRLAARREMQKICRHAVAVSYVTASSLQQRYPPSELAFSTSYSSIELPHDAFAVSPRRYEGPASRLVAVGTLEFPYKGFDILIEAIARLERPDRPFVTIVGGGKLLPTLEGLARRLRVAESVCFAGKLARDKVFELLDHSDLFVMPSRGEGLPRAMIEAMARGLPCIGSGVGGIPELLDSDAIVPVGQPDALAKRIAEVAKNISWLNAQSTRNLERAKEFESSRLATKRREFYRVLLERSRHNR